MYLKNSVVQALEKRRLSLENDILDLSIIAAGKLELNEQDFDFRSQFDDLVRSIRLKIPRDAWGTLLNRGQNHNRGPMEKENNVH